MAGPRPLVFLREASSPNTAVDVSTTPAGPTIAIVGTKPSQGLDHDAPQIFHPAEHTHDAKASSGGILQPGRGVAPIP